MGEERTGKDSESEKNNTIRAVDRALEVLLCFSVDTPALSMTEISVMVGINKSTVHRLLATLEEKRFVRRDPETGIYRLGFQLLQMANLTLEDVNIRHVSLPFMRKLNEEFRETVDLAILDGDEVMFVDALESPQRIKLAAAPGQHLPAYNTASGKAILSLLPEREIVWIYKKYNQESGPGFESNLEAFLDDLAETRQRGYALDCEGLEAGINAVGSPIRGVNNRPIASLAIAGPSYRLDLSLMHTIGKKLVAATKEISNIIFPKK
jgi:DNA-binding IclR family transcriptional regulator